MSDDYKQLDVELAAYQRGFEEGHEAGFGEGLKMGHIQAVSEGISVLTNILTRLTPSKAETEHDKDSE